MNILTTRASVQFRSASRSPRRLRLLAVEIALVVTLLVLLAGRLITGEFPRASVGGESRPIGVLETIVVTTVFSLAAWGSLALLERFSARAGTVWLPAAIAVLLLSLSGPISQGADTNSTLVLLALHLGAAAALIPLMWASAGRRDQ